MNDNINKVRYTTDADRYKLVLPVKCNFVLEKNADTGRYDITVKNFSNLKNSETFSCTMSEDTIDECFLAFGKTFPRTTHLVDLN